MVAAAAFFGGYIRVRIRDKDAEIRDLSDDLNNRKEKLDEARSQLAALKSQNEDIKRKLPIGALHDHEEQLKQGNYGQAIAILEEWFELQRLEFGAIAKILAEHYISYFEPEIIRSSLARAEQAGMLASICLGQPKEVIDLLNEIQIRADEIGSSTDSPQFERALDAIEDFWGPAHPQDAEDFIIALLARARGNIDSGNFWIAMHLARRAQNIAEKRLYSPRTIYTSIDILAESLFRLGRYSDAEQQARRALAICEETEGAEHADLASILVNLGNSRSAQGDHIMAQSLYERALVINRKALGPDHPNTAAILINLAHALEAQGDYVRAQSLMKQAVVIVEKALGVDHRRTADMLSRLAASFFAQGNFSEARSRFERVMAIREKVLGTDHPDTAATLSNLGATLAYFGEYEKSRQFLERALAIREKALGADHPDTAATLTNLAGLHVEQGDHQRAKTLYEMALAINERVFGADHPNSNFIRDAIEQIRED